MMKGWRFLLRRVHGVVRIRQECVVVDVDAGDAVKSAQFA